MKTLRQLVSRPGSIPQITAWYLADLGEARGRQELFTRQAPQKLKTLREHAIIESAVSSNRMEGVTVDRSRVGTLIFGKPLLRDRAEEEVRGYRDALGLIHDSGSGLPISEHTVKRLHAMCRGDAWDAGRYKEADSDIVEHYPDGRQRIRFRTVAAVETPAAMGELIALRDQGLADGRVHPLIMMAAWNLDFLCIHPFRDGNGRASRLLLLLDCYHQGFEVGRYLSLERLIEETKDRYYETLEQGSAGWHDGKNDPWPYVNYLLSMLRSAYREFEKRLGDVRAARGTKTEAVVTAIGKAAGDFQVSDILAACPAVSLDMIRRILKNLKAKGLVECLGRGQRASWRRTDRWGNG